MKLKFNQSNKKIINKMKILIINLQRNKLKVNHKIFYKKIIFKLIKNNKIQF